MLPIYTTVSSLFFVVCHTAQVLTKFLAFINPYNHYSVHKNPLMFSVLSQLNPVHTSHQISFKNRFNIIPTFTPTPPKGCIHLRFPRMKSCIHFSSPQCVLHFPSISTTSTWSA